MRRLRSSGGVTPLDAQACVWPRHPLGQAAQIVATLPRARTPPVLTRAVVEWDMVRQSWGAPGDHCAISGRTPDSGAPSSFQRWIWRSPGRRMCAAGAGQARLDRAGHQLPLSAIAKTPTSTGLAGCAEPPAQAGTTMGETP
jgi:hypothetical protein